MGDIAQAGQSKHRHRNLMTKFLKNSRWPPVYHADLRVVDPRTKGETVCSIPLLLPHEIIRCIDVKNTDKAKLLTTDRLDVLDRHQLRDVEARCPARFLPLALWADGVACKWDRSQSLDLVVMSFPGWGDQWSAVRIPLVALEHRYIIKGATMDDVFQILAWSLRHAFLGVFPTARHDGPWGPQDAWRRRRAGSKGIRSTIVRITGDWKMYKELWRFPQHNEARGICWLCRATPATFKDPSSRAAWRTERLDHWQSLRRIFEQGLEPCPLVSLPFFNTAVICRIDWLHAMDLGMASDWLGQFWAYLLPRMPGASQEERLKALWAHVDAGYVRHPGDSRIDTLTVNMLCLNHNAPKLKVHAAECRGLIPIAADMANLLLDPEDVVDETVRQAMVQLATCYTALSHTTPDRTAVQAESCHRFCALYIALEERVGWPFHVRPKMHMAQELLEMQRGSDPTLHWTYRDEDFGGSMAFLWRPRGGARLAATAGLNVLRKFIARHRVPVL